MLERMSGRFSVASLMSALIILSLAGNAEALVTKYVKGTSKVAGTCPDGCTPKFRIKKGGQVLCDNPVNDSDACHTGSPWTFTWKEEWGAGENAVSGTGTFTVECTCFTDWSKPEAIATIATYNVIIGVDLDLAGIADDREEDPGGTVLDESTIALYCRATVPSNLTQGTMQLSATNADHIEVYDGETKIIDGGDTSETWTMGEYGNGKT